MRVPVKGVFALRGHPLLKESDGPYQGWLVFENVIDSNRTVTEYIGESRATKNFKEPYDIKDGPFLPQATGSATAEFAFEGLQIEPRAWIDNWIVRAGSFELVIDSGEPVESFDLG
ncbi:hypothetical protein [Dyella acidisoli]|uniref:Uncharacterized protein n=1 Tax=Dyella acidisoli TaxID=1867834 RepID=A0ABQ5XT71_9GAMM|nr:hypothetical protein [Dyella acidisoli]GLQ95090.1 hypothetical protein GCM10007901_40440 [Dyella acidisoli]